MIIKDEIKKQADKLAAVYISNNSKEMVVNSELSLRIEQSLLDRHKKSRDEGIEEAAILAREEGYDMIERKIRDLKEKP